MDLRVPVCKDEISGSWLSEALGMSIEPDSVELEGEVQAGTGFLSSMIRVKCRHTPSSTAAEPLHLIVKLLPRNSPYRDLVIAEGFDKTEIGFYSVVMDEVLEVAPELVQYLCKCYGGWVEGGEGRGSVLILEDLRPSGYFTIPFQQEASWERIEELTRFLALFHFAGHAIQEGGGTRLDARYPFLQGTNIQTSSMFYEMAKEGFKALDILLKDAGRTVLEAYQSLRPHSDMIISKVQGAGAGCPTLIHGDLWTNNLLFNENPSCPTKVIDWQLLGYRDPTFDLSVTLLSSLPSQSLSRANVEGLLKDYYTQFLGACEKKGLKGAKRDWTAFSDFFYSWGMGYALLWFLMTPDPFAHDFPKLVNIYKFLVNDIQIHKFLLSETGN